MCCSVGKYHSAPSLFLSLSLSLPPFFYFFTICLLSPIHSHTLQTPIKARHKNVRSNRWSFVQFLADISLWEAVHSMLPRYRLTLQLNNSQALEAAMGWTSHYTPFTDICHANIPWKTLCLSVVPFINNYNVLCNEHKRLKPHFTVWPRQSDEASIFSFGGSLVLKT